MARDDRPPHAAKLPQTSTLQKKSAEPERQPHPAKVVQRREPVPAHQAKVPERRGVLPSHAARVAQRAALPNALVNAQARCSIVGTQQNVVGKKPQDDGWSALAEGPLKTFCETATAYPLWHLGADFPHPCALYGTWAFGGMTVVFFRYEPTKADMKTASWKEETAHTTSRATLSATYDAIIEAGYVPTVWIRPEHNEIALDFCLSTVYNGKKIAKKKCFLTTACTQARGLPDDCFELTTLRAFRDDYLLRLPGGPAVVQAYYDLAPRILEGIESSTDADARLEQLYDELVAPCVGLIVSGKEQAAVELYAEKVRALEREYLGEGSSGAGCCGRGRR